jgi:hypothetical protein
VAHIRSCPHRFGGPGAHDENGTTKPKARQSCAPHPPQGCWYARTVGNATATSPCSTPPGASRKACATTIARQVLAAAETVPTPLWSTACRFSAAPRRNRYEHGGDARGRPRGTAACWGSWPTANGGRSGTCTSSLARLLPGACPTSALNPSSRRSCPSRRRGFRGPHPSGPQPGPAITEDRPGPQYCDHKPSLRPPPRDERVSGILPIFLVGKGPFSEPTERDVVRCSRLSRLPARFVLARAAASWFESPGDLRVPEDHPCRSRQLGGDRDSLSAEELRQGKRTMATWWDQVVLPVGRL